MQLHRVMIFVAIFLAIANPTHPMPSRISPTVFFGVIHICTLVCRWMLVFLARGWAWMTLTGSPAAKR